jgi:hypothetical protein
MPDGNAPDQVWGEVLGPDGSTRGSVQLWHNAAKERYDGSFQGFAEAGRYLIFIQAGQPGNPAKTTPPAVVQIFYAGASWLGLPILENPPALALPSNGQAMEVEDENGGEWRIHLTRGQRVVIESSEVSARRDVALELTGSGGDVLATADQWGVGFGEAIRGWEAPVDGFYRVKATFAAGSGTANCRVRAYVQYEAGDVNQTLATQQTIAFNPPANHPSGGVGLLLAATSTSGLPVRFELRSGPGILVGSNLTASGGGVIAIRAYQDGDASWDSAVPVERTIVIIAGTADSYETWAQGIFGADYATRGAAAHDADGDGQSNMAEWLAKTDPSDAADRFELASTLRDVAGFHLRWFAREGVEYRVCWSHDFLTWTEFANSRVTGAGAEVSHTDSAARDAGKFYRVEIVQP